MSWGLKMELNNLFFWFDVDGVIIDDIGVKRYLEEKVFNKLVKNSAARFWEIYRSLIKDHGQVSFDKALSLWVNEFKLEKVSLIKMIKDLDFGQFVYDDFKNFIPVLQKAPGFGFFTSGTIWYQKEKIFDTERMLGQMNLSSRKILVSEDKTQLFGKMRKFSSPLKSVYIDNRLPFLEMALEQKAADLGVLMNRVVDQKPLEDKQILVVENFDNLMKELNFRTKF